LQILTAGVPILCTIGAGCTIGFSATFLPQLQSNASTIHVTAEESSWIASIAAFAMAPGCLVGGFIMQKYGRKFAHYFLCLPTIIGWILIYLAESVTLLLVGRFLTG
jgi:MFS family permease